MKALVTTLAVSAMILAAICISLKMEVNSLNRTISKAGNEIEMNDEHWASLLGDYQIDVDQDSIWVRDENKLVGSFPLEYDKDPLGTMILEDNQ